MTTNRITPAQLDEIEAVARTACVPLASGGQLARLRASSREYIATLTPGTTLALIAEVRDLDQRYREQRAILTTLREIVDSPDYAELQIDRIDEQLKEAGL